MKHTVKILDGKPVKIVDMVVHKFYMADGEDPQIMIAEPLWNWENSESGKWVMEKSIQPPVWTREADNTFYGYRVCVKAELREDDAVFYSLKWGS